MPNIWSAQEKIIHFYRILSCGIAAFAILLLVLNVVSWNRDPIVVTKSGKVQEFYQSLRSPVTIEKSDVESFAAEFLTALYVWDEFNAERLEMELTPIADEALIPKLVDGQGTKLSRELKGKKLEQEIAFLKIKVLDDRVVCNFDRILKISGIPLVIPMQVTLTMIQGDPIRMNPKGIYVSGILENEGAK